MSEGDSFVGRVSRSITDQWNIPEQFNKPIVNIIKDPDYVFYNKEENGLEYYKNIEEGVTLVVRTTKKNVLYLATIYPSSATKLANRKNKEMEIMEPDIIDKYRYREPV